jgi:hypothetical protein
MTCQDSWRTRQLHSPNRLLELQNVWVGERLHEFDLSDGGNGELAPTAKVSMAKKKGGWPVDQGDVN